MRTLCFIGLLLSSACVGGDGAPVIAVESESFSSITLDWQHPLGAAPDGYAVEERILPQPFAVLETVPPSMLYAQIPFADSAPELQDYELRVRALPDLDGTRASAAVPHHRGLRTPRLHCLDSAGQPAANCQHPAGEAPRLQWAFVSTAADTLLLERQPTLNGFAAGDFQPLPVSFPATSFTDGGATSGEFVYRLTVSKGAEQSAAAFAGVTTK